MSRLFEAWRGQMIREDGEFATVPHHIQVRMWEDAAGFATVAVKRGQEMERLEKAVYNLWRIIDDIDTTSDIAKSDNELYRTLVEKLQQQRWQHLKTEEVDGLYAKHYTQKDA